MSSEKYVPLTNKMIAELCAEITELVTEGLTIHSSAVKGEDGWQVEFYGDNLKECNVVGNLYIPDALFNKLQELMRIELAGREDLTEALVHDDKEIRDAADLRMYELQLKAAKLAEVHDNRKLPTRTDVS